MYWNIKGKDCLHTHVSIWCLPSSDHMLKLTCTLLLSASCCWAHFLVLLDSNSLMCALTLPLSGVPLCSVSLLCSHAIIGCAPLPPCASLSCCLFILPLAHLLSLTVLAFALSLALPQSCVCSCVFSLGRVLSCSVFLTRGSSCSVMCACPSLFLAQSHCPSCALILSCALAHSAFLLLPNFSFTCHTLHTSVTEAYTTSVFYSK